MLVLQGGARPVSRMSLLSWALPSPILFKSSTARGNYSHIGKIICTVFCTRDHEVCIVVKIMFVDISQLMPGDAVTTILIVWEWAVFLLHVAVQVEHSCSWISSCWTFVAWPFINRFIIHVSSTYVSSNLDRCSLVDSAPASSTLQRGQPIGKLIYY